MNNSRLRLRKKRRKKNNDFISEETDLEDYNLSIDTEVETEKIEIISDDSENKKLEENRSSYNMKTIERKKNKSPKKLNIVNFAVIMTVCSIIASVESYSNPGIIIIATILTFLFFLYYGHTANKAKDPIEKEEIIEALKKSDSEKKVARSLRISVEELNKLMFEYNLISLKKDIKKRSTMIFREDVITTAETEDDSDLDSLKDESVPGSSIFSIFLKK